MCIQVANQCYSHCIYQYRRDHDSLQQQKQRWFIPYKQQDLHLNFMYVSNEMGRVFSCVDNPKLTPPSIHYQKPSLLSSQEEKQQTEKKDDYHHDNIIGWWMPSAWSGYLYLYVQQKDDPSENLLKRLESLCVLEAQARIRLMLYVKHILYYVSPQLAVRAQALLDSVTSFPTDYKTVHDPKISRRLSSSLAWTTKPFPLLLLHDNDRQQQQQFAHLTGDVLFYLPSTPNGVLRSFIHPDVTPACVAEMERRREMDTRHFPRFHKRNHNLAANAFVAVCCCVHSSITLKQEESNHYEALHVQRISATVRNQAFDDEEKQQDGTCPSASSEKRFRKRMLWTRHHTPEEDNPHHSVCTWEKQKKMSALCYDDESSPDELFSKSSSYCTCIHDLALPPKQAENAVADHDNDDDEADPFVKAVDSETGLSRVTLASIKEHFSLFNCFNEPSCANQTERIWICEFLAWMSLANKKCCSSTWEKQMFSFDPVSHEQQHAKQNEFSIQQTIHDCLYSKIGNRTDLKDQNHLCVVIGLHYQRHMGLKHTLHNVIVVDGLIDLIHGYSLETSDPVAQELEKDIHTR
jgi:hypothetical protein